MESLILSALALSDILNPVKNFGMVAILLGFVIFVHELGHFLVAKLCGVKIDKFYIGFDVPIPLGFFTIPGKLVHFQWGETEYGIGAIPLGGYVKMLGQDDNPQNAESESDRTRIRDEQGNVKLDPRSYPAKSVPARMAIISAGVIMNIIFGFIFATVAYRVGVEIEPAVVGSTSPGDPAWKLNLQAGDRILQVGKDSPRNEHMRFIKDMMLNLALYGEFDKPIDVLVRHPDGEEEWVQLVPSDRQRNSKEMSRPTLGVSAADSTEFGKLPTTALPLFGDDLSDITVSGESIKVRDYATIKQLMATHPQATLKLTSKVASGDRVVAIDGQDVNDFADIQRLLALNPEKPIVLTIQRAPKKGEATEGASTESATAERYTLEIAPRPAADFGVEMDASPITAVQKDSPAENAGILPGDRLVTFDGGPIGDPLLFPQTTLAQIGETVEVELERPEGKTTKRLKVNVELRAPNQTFWSPTMSNVVAVETLGIAYEVTTKVAHVREGGPASGKLQPGDEVVKVKFEAAGPTQKKVEETVNLHPEEEVELDGKMYGWPYVVHNASISRLPDTKLLVTVKRDGKELEDPIELVGVPSQDLFIDHRNLSRAFTELQELHVAESWGEAMSLGAREMKERMLEVFTVVTRLVTGRISLMQMGGPISIFRMAGAEADRGITDLLMFFAFLSANLAVLNFLPIPALDGGHMVFLIAEAVRRKPVDENLQMKLSAAGILSLLALMLFVTILDVQRLFW